MAETIGIVGGGALGTLLAAKLARAGHSILVFTRSETRRDALRHEFHGVAAECNPEVLRTASLLFFCVKSHDTKDAADAVARLGAAIAGVCSLQNGWDHMGQLESILAGTPLLAGATSLGAYFDAAGALHASTEGTTYVAPWGGTEARWAEYTATVLQSAGFKAEAREDGKAILWRKLALNAAVNPLTALLNRPNGALLDEPHLLRLAEAAAWEAAAVGIELNYLPSDFDPGSMLQKLLEETRGNRSSMAEDLSRGRPTEVDAIVGAVTRAARQVGEETPILESFHLLIRTAEAP